jgi:asparagine synthase (glutamine-hydrolysing)
MMHALAGVWVGAPGAPSAHGTDGADGHCARMLAAMSPAASTRHRAERYAGAPDGVLGSAPYHPGPELALAAPEATECLLVADARLHNRAELSQKLGLPGDAAEEVLLKAAWRRWGSGMVDHLLGGFALACWDTQQQTLFLARDHAGERPLFFADGPSGAFAFASLPVALCQLPWVGPVIDVARVSLLLSLAEPWKKQSCFRGVDRLAPAHWLKWSARGVEIRRYWEPAAVPAIRYRRDQDYEEDLRERLDRAVAARMGEGSVAAELSGGLDSSSVAVTAASLLAQQRQRLTAFTAVPAAGYDGQVPAGRFGDEGPIAAEAAALYSNIDHVRVDSSRRDLVQSWAQASRLTGEPPINPMNRIWLDSILDGVRRRGLKVLLQGGAGNATISYDGLDGLAGLFRRGRWVTLLRQVRALRAGGHTSWRGGAAWATAPSIPLALRRIVQPELRAFTLDFSPVHPDRIREFGLVERALETFHGTNVDSGVTRRRMFDLFDSGPFNAAAAAEWQVEQRDPTQDKHLTEFCFAIPPEQYLAGGQARSLIRRAMQGRLPEATLRRSDRGLQAADWYLIMGAQRDRLSAELRRTRQSPLVRHLIDTPRLSALLEHWPSAGYDQGRVANQWHLALSRGIAAASFLAAHDPDMPKDAESVSAADAKRPGA